MAEQENEIDMLQENDYNDFKAENDLVDGELANIIHIRIQKRVGRKHITTVEGIGDEFDHKKILKAWRKMFNCTGSVAIKKNEGEYVGVVIQLAGDQRQNISQFLVDEGITKKDYIKIHGA